MNELSATEFEFNKNSIVGYQTCCGKFIIEYRYRRNILEYSIEELDEGYWKVYWLRIR